MCQRSCVYEYCLGYKSEVGNDMVRLFIIYTWFFCVVSSLAYAGVEKITRVGKEVLYVPTLESDAKTLNVPKIVGPGSIPIGGMVAIMNHIDGVNAWQPPASGVIKNGFMRADGTTITQAHRNNGCKFSVSTVLPNMTNRIIKGGSTSNSTGGSDYVKGHYHSNSAGSNAATSLNFVGGTTSWNGQASYAGYRHTHTTGGYGGGTWHISNGMKYTDGGPVCWSAGPQTSWESGTTSSPTISSTAAYLTGSNAISGNLGNTSGCDGSSDTSCSGDPAYVTTVWVIRVR